MNFTIFRSFQGRISQCFKELIILNKFQFDNIRGIHQICTKYILRPTINSDIKPINLLTPVSPQFYQFCGIKQKGLVKRYCKDCTIVTRRGRMFVYCKSFTSHKQMSIKKKEKYLRILTSVSQKKIRDW